MSASTRVLDAPVTAAATPEDTTPREPQVWWARAEVWLGLLILAACCAFIFVQLDPKLLFRNTTPAGGDTGAHVWWPAYLGDHLLPWRLSGWSPDFYAGFPAGQFYFPFPAVLIVVLRTVIPYNVAFKLITALGPLLLPVGAYVFARGLRAPEPTPPALAVAATGFLFFNGDPGQSAFDRNVTFDQHIMGGNLASNLAGEFSFTLALALALCFLGALAWSMRTKRSPWLPAVLLAATATSHLVVAVFAVAGAAVIVLGSPAKPAISGRNALRILAGLVAAVAVVFFATGTLSNVAIAVLVAAAAAVVLATFWPRDTVLRTIAIGSVGTLLTAVWSVPLAATLQYTTDMRYGPITAYGSYMFPWSYLFGVRGALPWQWGAAALITIAVVGGVLGRRRSTLALVVLTALTGLMFLVWSSVQIAPAWNLRVLPFWYLCVFLLMGVGVAELVRGAAWLARRLRARALAAADVGEPRDVAPPRPWLTTRAVGAGTAIALTVVLAVGALINIDHSKDFIPSWVKWNESGYQDLVGQGPGLTKAYPEYKHLIDTVGKLPPGRTIVEGGQVLDHYGTPLALMLIPYWTNSRIPTMEGLYYESSATTPYVFMALATVDGPGNASNPVRGITYKTFASFSLGVRYLQLLGARYFLAHSSASRKAASADPRLKLVATIPTTAQGIAPDVWDIYEVADSPTVAPLPYQPVVVDAPLSSSERTRCRNELVDAGVKPSDIVRVHDWQDCISVPWFNDPAALDRPLVAGGPSSWQHAQPTPARSLPKLPLAPVTVSSVRQTRTGISFHVSRTGVPILVKTSYFPNWEASGASGPYRATPNFMVVVPTGHDVHLTYGTTGAEWLGRLLTLVGLAGLVALVWWGRRSRGARPIG